MPLSAGVGSADIVVERPPPSATVSIPTQALQRYVLAFDFTEARARISGDDLVIAFEQDGGRIVFQDLAAMALSGQFAVLVVDGTEVASDEVVTALLAAQEIPEINPVAGDEGEAEGETEDEEAPEGSGGDSSVDIAGILATLTAQDGIGYREQQFALIESEDPLEDFDLETEEVAAPGGGTAELEVADPVGFAGQPAEGIATEFVLSAATRPATDESLVVVQARLDLPFPVVEASGTSLGRAAADPTDAWTVDLDALERLFGIGKDDPADPSKPITDWDLSVANGRTTLTVNLNPDLEKRAVDLATEPGKSLFISNNIFRASFVLTPPANDGRDIEDATANSVSLRIREGDSGQPVESSLVSVPVPKPTDFDNLGVSLVLDPQGAFQIDLLVEPGVTLAFTLPDGVPVLVDKISSDGGTFYTFRPDPSRPDPSLPMTDGRPLLTEDQVVTLIESFAFTPMDGNDGASFEISIESPTIAAAGERFDLAVDDVVDGSELLQNNLVIPPGATVVGDETGPTALGLMLTQARDSTSQAGPSRDEDAPFTQGGGDLDGSERVTVVAVTLEVQGGAPLPELDFMIPTGSGIVLCETNADRASGTISWIFKTSPETTDQAVSALVESFTVERRGSTFVDHITVKIETTTEEIANAPGTVVQGEGASPDQTGGLILTDPGAEDPGNNKDVDGYTFTIVFQDPPVAIDDRFDVDLSAETFSLFFNIDVSGSMGLAFDGSDNPGRGESRLDAAIDGIKAALQAFVDRASALVSEVVLQPFNGSFPLDGARAPLILGDLEGYDSSDPTDPINIYLDGLFANNGTQFEGPLTAASDFLADPTNQSVNNLIYHVSDGLDNDNYDPDTNSSLQALYDDSIPNLQIFAFGLGEAGTSEVNFDQLDIVVAGENAVPGGVDPANADNIALAENNDRLQDLFQSVLPQPTVEGNVLTNDNLGAAPATVTGIGVGRNVDPSVDVDQAGSTTIPGLFGTLTIEPDGDILYEVTVEPADLPQGGATEVFTYAVTALDGDTATAVIEIGLNREVLMDSYNEDDALAFDPPVDDGGDITSNVDEAMALPILDDVLEHDVNCAVVHGSEGGSASVGDGAGDPVNKIDDYAGPTLLSAGPNAGSQASLMDVINAVQVDVS